MGSKRVRHDWATNTHNYLPFVLIFKTTRLKDECFQVDMALNEHCCKTNFNVIFSLPLLNSYVERNLPEKGKFCSGFCVLIISFITQVVHCLLTNFTHHYLGMIDSWHYLQDLIELIDIHSLSIKMRVRESLPLYVCILAWPSSVFALCGFRL